MDAVIDMAVGIAVDKTRSRWGRTRGYFLFMALPYALLFVATFAVPDWGQTAQLVYAFLTFKVRFSVERKFFLKIVLHCVCK